MTTFVLPSGTLPRIRDRIWFPTQTLSSQIRALKQQEDKLKLVIASVEEAEAPTPIGPAKEHNDVPAVHESTDNDADSDTDQYSDVDDDT